MSKKKIQGMSREQQNARNLHLTRPPRLEGKVKNAMMNPVRKPKKPR